MDEAILKTWESDNYMIVRKAINTETLEILGHYCHFQMKSNYFNYDVVARKAKYSDLVMESLLLSLQPRLESLTQKQLLPTYSYMRVYRKNDDLKAHTDRGACEFSVTLPISYNSNYLWPIFVHDRNNNKIDVALDKGDLLLYKGCQVTHGRDPFLGENWIQVFLHYVDKDGANANQIFDKRKSLGVKLPFGPIFFSIKRELFQKLGI